MLIPSQINPEDIAPGFALIVEPVRLNPHPSGKDVYPHESKEYDYTKDDWKTTVTGKELVRIHKQGFDRLAQAAKVDWLPAQIVRDPNHSGRMMASIEGMIRTSTGELYRVQDIAGMDLDIEREKIISHYSFNGKFDEKKQWMVDRDYLQKKDNQPKLCISGAKNRVIKQLLCLHNTYTVAELAKEFVAVRIVPRLDMNDEYTRKRVVDVQIAAMAGIYGLIPNATPQPQQIEMAGAVPAAALIGDDGAIETTVANGEPEKKTYTINPEEDIPFSLASEPAVASPESLRADFENSDVEGQAKTLTILASKKGYALQGWLKQQKKPMTLQTLSPGMRMKVYDHLCGLADAERGKVA